MSRTKVLIKDSTDDVVDAGRMGVSQDINVGVQDNNEDVYACVWLNKEQARELANGLLQIIAEIEGA